jgi:hypothetical protein
MYHTPHEEISIGREADLGGTYTEEAEWAGQESDVQEEHPDEFGPETK